jgi:N-acetylmuramoyl-L-alanine amidase
MISFGKWGDNKNWVTKEGVHLMNKIFEHFLLPLLIVMSIIYVANSFSNQMIELNKVFHHRTDNPVDLERATVSLYFSCDPQMRELKENGFNTRKFFFSQVMITDDCRAMVALINQYNNVYAVKIKEVTAPEKGIELSVTFDPEKLALSYDSFDSIGLKKGIVLHLYNKELLHQLEHNKNQPILRMLWHSRKPCIVIDFGHGGSDTGTLGLGTSPEKEVCLAIGTNVVHLLQDHGYAVVLTRDSDRDVLLDERTLCANKSQADCFVSIHANSAFKDHIFGVETFCMCPNLFKESFSDLSAAQKSIVAQYATQKSDVSYKLAQALQHHVCKAVTDYHSDSVDRKVKRSVTQVLLGTHMPAVLIEVGFLSHPKESALLCSTEYQKTVARGICNGIVAFLSC